MNHDTYPKWHTNAHDNLLYILRNLDTLNIEEIDLWLSFIPGGNFNSLRAGQYALTKDNQKVIILGYTEKWRPED